MSHHPSPSSDTDTKSDTDPVPIAVEFEQIATYPSSGHARRLRATLSNGRSTTVHVATWALEQFRLRLVEVEPPRPVEKWCAQSTAREALNGAFFTKPDFEPLGELRLAGRR